MRLRNAARSEISGSRAALRTVVVPRAVAPAMSRFSVAPTLGYSSTTSAPISFSARPSIIPWLSVKVAPSASSDARCMSTGRDPKSSPPGRATLARPTPASSGPSTAVDARICSTSS